jgi:hypothetical protein
MANILIKSVRLHVMKAYWGTEVAPVILNLDNYMQLSGPLHSHSQYRLFGDKTKKLSLARAKGSLDLFSPHSSHYANWAILAQACWSRNIRNSSSERGGGGVDNTMVLELRVDFLPEIRLLVNIFHDISRCPPLIYLAVRYTPCTIPLQY